FAEKFVNLCRVNGIAVFLADVNFTKDVSKNIRRFLVEHSIIRQFVHDLSEFENVASGQVILMAQRGPAPKSNAFLVKNSLQDVGVLENQSEVVAPTYNFLGKIRDPVVIRLLKEKVIAGIAPIQ